MLVAQQTGTGQPDHESAGEDTSSSIGESEVMPVEKDGAELHRQSTMEKYDGGSGSVWGNISIFKDFFLAAFSDGYQNVSARRVGFLPPPFRPGLFLIVISTELHLWRGHSCVLRLFFWRNHFTGRLNVKDI